MSNSNITAIYQNVRGLNTKTHEFYKSVSSGDYELIAISETWIQNGLHDSELVTDAYTVYRKDRSLDILNVKKGGGVLLAVKHNLRSVQLNLAKLQDLVPESDVVGCEIFVESSSIYVFVVYVKPNSPLDHYHKLFDYFASFCLLNNGKILLMGDFNIPLCIENNIVNPKILALQDFMAFTDLIQSNTVLNNNRNMLDLVLTNVPCTVVGEDMALVPEDSYHPALKLSVSTHNSIIKNFEANSQSKKYNFHKTNFQLLYHLISQTNWDFLNECTNVDSAVLAFYSKLTSYFDQCVPLFQTKKINHSYPTWYNKEIILALKEKKLLHTKWKTTKLQADYTAFSKIRRQIKIKVDIAYKNYISSTENSLKSDPKRFWKYVKQKAKKSRIPGSLSYNNSVVDSPSNIVNAFAKYFSSVYVKSTDPSIITSPDNKSNENISIRSFREADILKALKKLKNKETAGFDKIPSFLLRDCAQVLSKPLHYIFNLSIQSNTFPDIWKKAKVCPVFKSGEANQVENYRPISILSNFSKVFEICIYDKLFCQVKNLISHKQHGFFHKRSTVTNLTCFLEKAYKAIKSKRQLDVIYTDFSKAFDRLDHGVVAAKLLSHGFHKNLVTFFISYLSNRRQFVEYNGFVSEEYLASSGAPQGSNLAPLIFALFINDITNLLHSDYLLFADDMKLFRIIQNNNDCLLLQQDIITISDWCNKNNLPLNVSKCKKMTISNISNEINYNYLLNGLLLPNCDSVKDLGIVIDKKLTFNEHIDQTIKSTLRTLGFIIRQTASFKNSASLLSLYNALIKSKLLYCSMVWFPVYEIHIKRLESVQRRFLKYLAFKMDGVYPVRGTPQNLLLSRFKLLSLRDCTSVSSQVFLHKLINNQVDAPELLEQLNFYVPPVNTRRHCQFYLEVSNTNLARKAPLYRSCSWFNDTLINANNIEFDLFSQGLNSFKANLTRNLITGYN